ncbi:cytochrome b [Dyella nitratireducens]|uniref:Cytochrome b n=1 Tax=Dyella nitratireducens TaxID=1849580 RepID=A0ABQ1FY81_9GAMM|nr:cytochrome b [Dyella nitratireducens]GGA33782.1 cytochrome b [Dyella nitratireducens]GLQ40776.1 cytochrome b [Dyella nitratireducens]
MSSTAPGRYAPALRWLHWIIFVFVLIAYVAINLDDVFPHGSSARSNVKAAHFLAGIAVLLLALPRMAVRFAHSAPPIQPPMDRWSYALSKITHLALYLFLIVQPIMGIITLQISGKPIVIFGVTVLPAVFGPGNRALGNQWEDIHGTVGTVFYYVIGLHILAALWHHFGRKDNTLRRML